MISIRKRNGSYAAIEKVISVSVSYHIDAYLYVKEVDPNELINFYVEVNKEVNFSIGYFKRGSDVPANIDEAYREYRSTNSISLGIKRFEILTSQIDYVIAQYEEAAIIQYFELLDSLFEHSKVLTIQDIEISW